MLALLNLKQVSVIHILCFKLVFYILIKHVTLVVVNIGFEIKHYCNFLKSCESMIL